MGATREVAVVFECRSPSRGRVVFGRVVTECLSITQSGTGKRREKTHGAAATTPSALEPVRQQD